MEPAESGSPFRKPRPGMVLDLLAAHRLPAAAAFMVGASESDRRCAEAARLARFLWAWEFFGRVR
jgi:phosphoglycolate phosphatase-like HAD superfamily hydrolase